MSKRPVVVLKGAFLALLILGALLAFLSLLLLMFDAWSPLIRPPISLLMVRNAAAYSLANALVTYTFLQTIQGLLNAFSDWRDEWLTPS